ncbi:MAG: hypothetical protein ABI406_18695 [Ktedonobacteraceae bacterium]
MQETLQEVLQRIAEAPGKQLYLWKGHSMFLIQQGTPRSAERWQLHTPLHVHYGDSLEEVVKEAEADYPEIRDWLMEFREGKA